MGCPGEMMVIFWYDRGRLGDLGTRMMEKPHIELDLAEQRLWREGQPVEITAKVFQLLQFFVEHPGRLQSKSTLLRQVWPETHVTEASIKDCVKNLRAALHDDATNPQFIETVRGRGYRYLGGIELRSDTEAPNLMALEGKPVGVFGNKRRLWLVISVLVSTVAALLWLQVRTTNYLSENSGSAVSLAEEPGIAVLPFENLSENAELDLLAGGLTEDLTTALAQLPNVLVSASAAARTASVNDQSHSAIAEALGVQYLLKGSVQSEGGNLRVSAQLIDTSTDSFVWTGRYDRPIAAFFPIQDDIVLGTLTELRVNFHEGDRVRAVKDTENLQSWLASTAAYGEFLKFNATANHHARALWHKALNHDPARAVPHAGLAFTHYYDAYRGWSNDRDASIALGREHAETALRRNPDLALAYQAMGALKLLQGEFEEGLMLRRRAVELGPNDFSAIGGLAAHLTRFGQSEEAVDLFRRALRLNPTPPMWVPIWFGHALHLNHQPEEAAEWLEMAVAQNPNQAYLQARLAAVYSELGREKDARMAADASLRLDPDLGLTKMHRIFPIEDEVVRDWFNFQLTRAGIPD